MKKHRINFFTVGIAIAITACATPTYNYVPEVKYVSFPDLGATTTVSVGDEMVKQGNLSAKEGITLLESAKISVNSLSPGFYPKVGEDDKHIYFSFATGDGKTSQNGLGTLRQGILSDPIQSIALLKPTDEVCMVTTLNLKSCKKNITFKKDNRSNESLNSFQQTLIYNGRVGNKVNIAYREFSGDRARPAFNNEVEYDLTVDKIISYKGAELNVISADNKGITFIVNKNFRQPNP